MLGYKSGDYDEKINRFFVILAVIVAVGLGVGLAVSGAIKFHSLSGY